MPLYNFRRSRLKEFPELPIKKKEYKGENVIPFKHFLLFRAAILWVFSNPKLLPCRFKGISSTYHAVFALKFKGNQVKIHKCKRYDILMMNFIARNKLPPTMDAAIIRGIMAFP